jgi:hypothetical protein
VGGAPALDAPAPPALGAVAPAWALAPAEPYEGVPSLLHAAENDNAPVPTKINHLLFMMTLDHSTVKVWIIVLT